MAKRGKFITFEGGDGCGKSTQARLLCEALREKDVSAVLTREPGGTEGAHEIRRLLVEGEVHRWDPLTETLLHCAARREHVEKLVRPSLEKGSWVVSDRYVDSTVAYQGYGYGVDIPFIKELHEKTTGRLMPDLTIILTMDVEAALSRTSSRGGKEDRYEKMELEFHERLQRGFLTIAQRQPERCRIIDAEQSIEAIHEEVMNHVTTA